MTNDDPALGSAQSYPEPPDQDPDLPDSDPRNPFDLILIGGPHNGQSLRRPELSDPTRKRLLLSSNEDGSPSAPFFAEYRATDQIHPFTGLRIYRFVALGIDSFSQLPVLAPHIDKDH